MMLFADIDWGKIAELFFATLPATLAACGGLVTAIAALIVGIRRGSALDKKLDTNTQITQAAATAAEEGAKKIDSTLEKTKTEAAEQARKAAAVVATQAVVVAKEVATQAAKQADAQTAVAVQTLTTAINGRTDELLRAERQKAFAEGQLAGMKEDLRTIVKEEIAKVIDVDQMAANTRRIEELNAHQRRNTENQASLREMIDEIRRGRNA